MQKKWQGERENILLLRFQLSLTRLLRGLEDFMNKIRLFYSYSHKDEKYREKLEIHLATLRNNKLIDGWHDRKIDAGDDWDEEIERNMTRSHIILLLFSPDFIASKACQKEVETALRLKKEKGIIFIPIILRECSWRNIDGISNIQALPKNGKAIKTWSDQDKAWASVYEGIKKKVEKIRDSIKPKIKDEFKKDLLRNPIENCTLDELFVYPDILKTNADLKQKLENNEIDSEKLNNFDSFKDKYILLEGEEQSGKTSLCNMLYVRYLEAGFYPILIRGESIAGKAEIKKIVDKQYNYQYESIRDYWSIGKDKRILLIDDVDEWNANSKNCSIFVASIKEYFECAVVFIDKLSNLSDRSTEHDYFSYFQHYTIRHLGHKKRNELIKKCIAHDERVEFDISNNEQLARLDKDTKHINTIIGANIVPSYPIFIVTIFHTVESTTPQDLSQTSYGHCYHAMITMNLGRSGIKAEDIDACFNYLTELAYFMFGKNKKTITEVELNQFTAQYEKKYVIQKNVIEILINENIVRKLHDSYGFQYVYIYYYFVAKFISQKMDNDTVKKQIAELMSNIHMKDNANIIIFITHHTNNKVLLDDITLSAMSTFDKLPEATLSGSEKNFIRALSANLENKKLPDLAHDVKNEREKNLEINDEVEPVIEQINSKEEENSNPLYMEIRKSAKSMEIIGQILKNKYGSLEKSKLEELFEEGQNVGLRLLKSFIVFVNDDRDSIEQYIQSRIEQLSKEKGKEISEKAGKKIVAQFSYSVIFGWLHKIVDSIGYDKLIEIADNVNGKTNTVASKLINLSIHTWYIKKLDLDKIKVLYHEFENDKNYQAIYLLKDIVSRHIYMHHIDYKDKQKIDSLLGFSVQKQISVQRKLKPS